MITEAWKEELESMPFISKQKGRMSQLLKQKSKVQAVREQRKTYDAYDFDKRSRDAQGNTIYHGAKKDMQKPTAKEDEKTQKIKPTILEKYDAEMNNK